ncbi:uncharacterized mitochondrial protein-like protein [Tanacetum coccineum]|uniref:Uncharacterized mitochondrial protein-like protein n=1 Tax=Tanacetum coccineum TaxID=301880 RepID=A0ABQ5FE02_9ASTR
MCKLFNPPSSFHNLCVLDFINDVNARAKSKFVKKSSTRKVWKPTGKVFTMPLRKPIALETDTPKHVVTLVYSRKSKKSKANVPVSKHKIIKSISANKKEPSKSWGSIVFDVSILLSDECTVKFGNDHVEKILGYGDYQFGNVMISRVYYVEGLGHNLFTVGQFYDSNLKVTLEEVFQDFHDTSVSSDDDTNFNQEPFVVKQDPDGIFCQRCTCKSCGKCAHIGYNCPPKAPIISNPEPCNQTIDELPQTLPSFDPTCYSEKENSLPYVSKPNFVDDSPNVFNPPPQPPMYSCEFCGNDARYGHYCTPQVPFIYPEPCYNQDFNFPQDFQDFHDFQQQYLCCENCGGPHKTFQCQPMNEDYYHEQNSCYDSNSFGFDQFQPPQYTVNHPIFNAQNELLNSQNKIMEQMTSICDMVGQYMQKKEEDRRITEDQAAKDRYWKIPICYDDDDDEESSIPLKDIITSGLPPCDAVTPVLLTEEPVDSLIMEDEHLDTIPATESDEVIKSSVEELVPIPSESKGIPDSECNVPECDETSPIFTTFLNPLFDLNDDFTSSDDEPLSDEDIDPHYFNAESNLIESLLNRDILIDFSPKFDYLLEEFSGELAHIDSIPPGIEKADFDLEEEIRFVENLLYDNSSPRPPEELNSTESFPPSHIPVEDSDSLMEEIDLFLASDESIPPGIDSDYSDSEGDNLFLERLLHDDPTPLPDIPSPTHVTFPFEDHHDLDFTCVVRVFLPFFTYPVTSSFLLSSGRFLKIMKTRACFQSSNHPVFDLLLIMESSFLDVPSKLPKVSLVNASLKKLKFHLTQFDSAMKMRTTPNALEEGKEIVENVVHTPSVTTIAPDIFKLDLVLLPPRLLRNRDAHIDYLRHTQEQANTLQEIVEQAKAKQPLDSELDFVCKYATRIQELLVYVQDTCPNAITPSPKKVVITPMNKVKKVRFVESLTSSSNIKQVESSDTSNSNTHVLSSTGVKCSTSNCGSKPPGNKRNDRISQIPSRNKKNKVEAQLRKVNKMNRVVKPICDVDVKHSLSNANSEILCTTCNKSMFDGVHDKYLLDLVQNGNNRTKSAKKHKKQNIWKPTGHVFTKVGFKWKPTGRTFIIVGNACPLTRFTSTNVVVQIVLWYLDFECSKHMTGNHSQLMNFVSKFLGTVRFRNDQIARIMRYGDYQLRNVVISRVYYVEGLGHNLFLVGQFCDADLKVAFWKNTCFIRNLEGIDLLLGSRDINLYIISLDDMLKSSPICLLSKSSKTKSWLWHRRLSHLNFGTLNKLAKDGLA